MKRSIHVININQSKQKHEDYVQMIPIQGHFLNVRNHDSQIFAER